MNLAIDIGNTRIKVAVFDERTLVYYDVIDDDIDKELALIYDRYDIDKVISSSTRKEITDFEKEIMSRHQLVRLSHETPVPFENLYQTKKTLGKDRIALAAGGAMLYQDVNALVIDLGTCITYDFVTADAKYLGGNIAPGLKMRLRAMDEFTSALPLVDPVRNEELLGYSTTTAIQNGAFYGIVFEIEGMVERLQKNYKDINVILTGGDAQFFAEAINSKIFVHPYFVLEGLNEIILYAS